MEKRLQTVLSHAGISSRRGAAELIESGKVSVDGKVIKEKGFRVDPSRHEITVEGRSIKKREKKYYFLLNKPKNTISTASDTHSRKKVTDLFKKIDARLYPVGRLDKNTTGILIVTNDGDLAHRLSHPSFGIGKEYIVTVNKYLQPDKIKKLEKGVDLDGKSTAPCRIRLRRRGKTSVVYRVTLHEGKKRQIRRMFEAVGARVTELKRVKYAGLTLGKLEEGEHRHLSAVEIKKLKNLR